MDVANLKDIFLSEFEDQLQQLNNGLISLEKDPGNQSVLADLMRSSHTVKGSAATMGYHKTASLTHALEDIFDLYRRTSIRPSPQVIGGLFITVDALTKSFESIRKTGQEANVDPITDEIQHIHQSLIQTSDVVATNPAVNPNRSSQTNNKQDVPSSVVPQPIQHVQEGISHIKVPVARLDNLMSLTEELLIDKMRMQELLGTSEKLDSIITHLGRLVSDMQFQVMQTRLVPLEQIFSRFPRMVRDTAAQYNKEIEFTIEGGEMEVDRSVIEKLSEPITHLIRNAIDHGIDKKGHIRLSVTREKQMILIGVEDNGSGVNWQKVISVALKNKVIDEEKFGTFTSYLKDFSNLPIDMIRLLYNPKISTKDEVTELSGRGVGLNVVDLFAKQLGGRLVYKNIPTGGTLFLLELPVAVAIIQSLLVRVGPQLFAIPFAIIDRSITIKDSEIKRIADTEAIVVNGSDVPIIRLDAIFTLPDSGNDQSKHPPLSNTQYTMTVVLIRRNEEEAGLIVDELYREQDIVIKSLPPVLKGAEGFSGTTFLEDGKTILVLDSNSLLDYAQKQLPT